MIICEFYLGYFIFPILFTYLQIPEYLLRMLYLNFLTVLVGLPNFVKELLEWLFFGAAAGQKSFRKSQRCWRNIRNQSKFPLHCIWQVQIRSKSGPNQVQISSRSCLSLVQIRFCICSGSGFDRFWIMSESGLDQVLICPVLDQVLIRSELSLDQVRIRSESALDHVSIRSWSVLDQVYLWFESGPD